MRRAVILAIAIASCGTEDEPAVSDAATPDASGLECGDYQIEWSCIAGCVASTPFELQDVITVSNRGVVFWRIACGVIPVCNTLEGYWVTDKVTGDARIEFDLGVVDVQFDDRYPITGVLKYVDVYSDIRHELKFKGETMYGRVYDLMKVIRSRRLDKGANEALCGEATLYMMQSRASMSNNLDKKLAGILVCRTDLNTEERTLVNETLGIVEEIEIIDETSVLSESRSLPRRPTEAANSPR